MSIFSKKKVATGSTKSSPAMPNPPTSTSTTTGTNVGNFTKKRRFGRLSKKALIVCIAVVLVVGGGAAVWQKYHNKPKPAKQKESTANCIGNSCSGVVNKPFLEAAVYGIITNDSQALFGAVENIQKIPNYQKDVDYLYVVVYYNISVGNAEKAKTYYTELENVYRVTGGYQDKSLSGVARTPESLKADIDFLTKQSDEASSYDKTIHKQ